VAGHGEKLTRKMEQAVAALLSESTIAKAAAKAGVSERTLRTWKKRPDFQAAYRAAQRDIYEESIVFAKQSARQATLTLYKNLTCGNPAAENQAAKILHDIIIRADAHLDLAGQVEELVRLERARERKLQ
jgi:hypothetical protein